MKIALAFVALNLCLVAGASASPIDGQVWNVVSQSCEGQPVAVPAGLRYRVDDSMIVKISTASESDTERCTQAEAFTRGIIGISSSDSFRGKVYSESGKLAVRAERLVCQAKVNGAIAEPATKDETKPVESSDLISYELTFTEKKGKEPTFKIQLQGDKACASGALLINLKK